MKPAAVTFLVISLLLTVVTSYVAGLGVNQAVLDYKGTPVKSNTPYFIQPVEQPDIWVSRGRRYVNMPCPQVALLSSAPMSFVFLLQSETYFVPLSTNLSIRYDMFDYCPESGILKVDNNPPYDTPDITAAGSIFSLTSMFKIEKDNDAYKFVYGSESNNIGVHTDPLSLTQHLVVDPTPLNVIFVPKKNVAHENPSFWKNMVPFF